MFQVSELAENKQPEVILLLTKTIKYIYGSNFETLGEEFVEMCYRTILKRFIGITIADIENAYDDVEVVKEKYQSLTREEFLDPIKKYWTKKNILIIEINKILPETKNKTNDELDMIEYVRNSENIYIASLKTGKWEGNEFQAYSIAKRFKDRIEQPEKNLMFRDAEKEYQDRFNQRRKETGLKAIKPIPPSDRIYARMFIQRCIDKKIKLIKQDGEEQV